MADVDDDQVDEALIEQVEDLPVRQGSQLEVAERARFVSLLAIQQDHIDQLAKQVEKLGGKPCVQPPKRPVIAGNEQAALHHLQQELRATQGQVNAQLLENASLRVRLNQALAKLEQHRTAT